MPEPTDQIGHRKNKGSRGGRPVGFDAEDYKSGNVVERAFNHLKNWRGLATRYDKHALVYRGGVLLAAIPALAVMTYETRPSSLGGSSTARVGVSGGILPGLSSKRGYAFLFCSAPALIAVCHVRWLLWPSDSELRRAWGWASSVGHQG